MVVKTNNYTGKKLLDKEVRRVYEKNVKALGGLEEEIKSEDIPTFRSLTEFEKYLFNKIGTMYGFDSITEQIDYIKPKAKGIMSLIFNPITDYIYKPVTNLLTKYLYNNNEVYNALAKVLPEVFKVTNKYEVIGAENVEKLPEDKGFVLVGNHGYHMDPVFIAAALQTPNVRRKVRFISKQGNFEDPLFRPFLIVTGTIPLYNHKNINGTGNGPDPYTTYAISPQAQSEIQNTLMANEGIGVFPEGTRNRLSDDLTVRDFKSGALIICNTANVPYLPVGITGKRVLGGGKVTVNIGEPVYLKNNIIKNEKTRHEARDAMQEQIISLIKQEPMPENPHARK